MSNTEQDSPIDQIVDGKLPIRVLKAISDMEIKIGEMVDWEDSKSPFRCLLSKDGLRIDVHLYLPPIKLILIIAGIVGAGGMLWTVVKVLFG